MALTAHESQDDSGTLLAGYADAPEQAASNSPQPASGRHCAGTRRETSSPTPFFGFMDFPSMREPMPILWVKSSTSEHRVGIDQEGSWR